jgi:ribosomal protein L11 methylase PrmA
MPDLLVAEAKRLGNFVTARGHLVLAGILASQFDAVGRVFEGLCFRLIRRRTQRGWTSGLFQKDG